MEYTYLAQDEFEIIDHEHAVNNYRKIKDPVTITITIKMDRSKYESQKAKFKEPLTKKIAKLFGF